jgi:hypothetical protein
MIPMPPGWRLQLLAHALVLTHPEGKQVATIHYRERVRPLRRLGAIVDEIVAATPGFAAERVGAPERLLTVENEHAALVTVSGVQDGAAAQRDLGIVFGDDFFAAVGGLCLRAERRGELTALVRDLVRKDLQMLGIRRRRFEYAAPPGWAPLARDLLVEWYPPGYPRDRTVLRVHPAYPIANAPASVDAAKIGRHVRKRGGAAEDPRPRAIATPAGLRGWGYRLCIEEAVAREIVVLDDARYRYLIELSSSELGRHAQALEAVVASVVPIPANGVTDHASDLLAYWLS